MSKKREKTQTEHTEFKIAGLDTPSGRTRVEKAHKKLFAAFHESHHALIRLVDFLDSPSFKILIKTVVDEVGERGISPENQISSDIIDLYMRILEEARTIREETSNTNEEFQRAIINMPPRQKDEPRKLVS